jgi:hypothetical protein
MTLQTAEHDIPPSKAPDTAQGNEPIPPGSRCLACHYSLAGVRQGPCPECGLHVGPAEIKRWGEREAWVKQFNLKKWYAAAVLIPIVYAIGALVYAGEKSPAIMTLIVLGITSAGTVITSEVLGSLGRPHDRALARRVWFRYAYLVHTPWLVTSGCAAIALGVAGIERLAGTHGDATLTVSFVGLVAWAIGSFCVLILFISRIANVQHRHTLRWTRSQIAVITVTVLFQFPFNAAIGFAGGMLAGTGALRLMGVDLFPGFE